ncbi:P-loop containing nucleoside triphosphate hydrolase protein [Dioscorea alata]|uniref:P-loop containing nucleoside triphosphate hydrolase protein n=1 Tax=Dioscorea alata TaxID=55571 RepID=A0ACB7UJ61_DIOAL|nr:P-loop containing nucleoside triphosphate hydrolase protein [Dioscorea alata]
MDFLSSITGVIFDHAWDPIRRHIGYLISYKCNINKLERKFDELDALRKDVQEMVDAARRERLEMVNNVVQNWLKKVDRMKEDVKKIKEKASVISNKHFLHIGLHYKLGKEAADHIKTTDDLIREGKFDSVSHKGPPPSATDSLLYNKDYMIFDSRKSHVKKILEALKYEAVHSIGIWGMGGVGKTMLVKDVAKQAKEQSLFGEVVMVTVSQNIDLKRIQTEIADCLGLVLMEESEGVRAAKLAHRLTTTKNKVLVILDDLWETLDLSKVGIRLPEMASTCKVVITTRNKYVCERMSCREIIELKILSDEECWNLFKSRAGDVVESPTIRKLAQKVARECAGLPLALVVLGIALKDKSSETWEAVLMRLKRSKEVDLPGVSKQVIQSIKLSFDFLESEAAKSCFLRCCLYPEDWVIENEQLMYMMVGGGILADVETLNEAQSRVDLLLDQLKACGLLLEGYSRDDVKMHDVVRDVAIQIDAAADHAFYVRAGQGLEEWPRTVESEMQNCRQLSLMCNDIKDLRPDPMQYPKLEMLILRSNNWLSSIPEMFFLHMGSLMVLDLSYTRIESLPKSLSCLTNLRVLNLTDCRSLKDISHINGLKMLEILNLARCPVSIVPKGVGWTQNLRFVYLYQSMDDLFSKEFPRFHKLEQLFMDKFEGSFRELITSLRYLTHLFINKVVDLDDPLSHELGSPSSWSDRLVKFRLCLLEKSLSWSFGMDGNERELQLMGTKPLTVWAKRLLEKTKQLMLIKFQETELISINNDIPPLVFSSLEYLAVNNWPKLTKLLDDELSFHEEIPLNQLKGMYIDNCPGLTNLIPSSLCQRSMQKLKRLVIADCPMMLELFPCDQGAHNITELLPSLINLNLTGLQSLQNVLQPFQCLPNLMSLSIDNCGVRYIVSSEMETVAILADPFPALNDLVIRNCQEMSEMISPPTSLQALCFFQGLSCLIITSCPRLTHLFSYKQAISMQHLGGLYIQDCAALGAVVISKENEEEACSSTHVANHESYNSPFPNLRVINLDDLPQLTAFHHPIALPVKWLHLTNYKIQGCPKLQEPLEKSVDPTT